MPELEYFNLLNIGESTKYSLTRFHNIYFSFFFQNKSFTYRDINNLILLTNFKTITANLQFDAVDKRKRL